MRKKKRPTVASPDLSAAWAKFYDSTKEDDLAALAADGWKSITQMVNESGKPLATITSRMKTLVPQKVFEKKIVRALTNNGVRELALYRPLPSPPANTTTKPPAAPAVLAAPNRGKTRKNFLA
jgi:hypothetical protein